MTTTVKTIQVGKKKREYAKSAIRKRKMEYKSEEDSEQDEHDDKKEALTDEVIIKKKEAKKEENIGDIMSKILENSSDLLPLAQRPQIEKVLEEAELDRKARKIIKKELKIKRDSAHRPILSGILDPTAERELKRIANRGIVQLFNKVHQHQIEKEFKEREIRDEKEKSIIAHQERAKASTLSVKKSSFLELLRMGGKK